MKNILKIILLSSISITLYPNNEPIARYVYVYNHSGKKAILTMHSRDKETTLTQVLPNNQYTRYIGSKDLLKVRLDNSSYNITSDLQLLLLDLDKTNASTGTLEIKDNGVISRSLRSPREIQEAQMENEWELV